MHIRCYTPLLPEAQRYIYQPECAWVHCYRYSPAHTSVYGEYNRPL